MSLAIRRSDGTKISAHEYTYIRQAADMAVMKLFGLADSKFSNDSNVWTKTFLKKTFPVEYRKCILDLEAENTLLRLCSGHWKADAMISAAITRRTEAEKTRLSKEMPSDTNDSQPPGPPHAMPVPHVRDAAPANAAKRSLVLSPGPKSPSASHVQKRRKDATTTNPLVSSNDSEFYSTQFTRP
jgi:hypothetical protein